MSLYKSITPFVLLQAMALILMMIFPELITWLPNQIMR